MKTYCTVHVIATNKSGQFLILQRAGNRSNPGTWNCITGHIKERESAEDAALRELKEETNLKGILVKSGEPHWSDHEDIRYVIIPVLVEVHNENDINIDAFESFASEWVTGSDQRVMQKDSLLTSLKNVGYQC